MEQDQQIEWQLFRDQACEHLRRVDHARRPRYQPLLQFLRLPSFGDVKCVDVLQKDDEILAFQTTWFVSRDCDRIATRLERLKHGRFLAPTLASIQLAESSTELEFLIDGLRSLFIPLENVESSVSIGGLVPSSTCSIRSEQCWRVWLSRHGAYVSSCPEVST